jgi:hypothetical protein
MAEMQIAQLLQHILDNKTNTDKHANVQHIPADGIPLHRVSTEGCLFDVSELSGWKCSRASKGKHCGWSFWTPHAIPTVLLSARGSVVCKELSPQLLHTGLVLVHEKTYTVFFGEGEEQTQVEFQHWLLSASDTCTSKEKLLTAVQTVSTSSCMSDSARSLDLSDFPGGTDGRKVMLNALRACVEDPMQLASVRTDATIIYALIASHDLQPENLGGYGWSWVQEFVHTCLHRYPQTSSYDPEISFEAPGEVELAYLGGLPNRWKEVGSRVCLLRDESVAALRTNIQGFALRFPLLIPADTEVFRLFVLLCSRLFWVTRVEHIRTLLRVALDAHVWNDCTNGTFQAVLPVGTVGLPKRACRCFSSGFSCARGFLRSHKVCCGEAAGRYAIALSCCVLWNDANTRGNACRC